MNIPQPLVEAHAGVVNLLSEVERRVAQTLDVYSKQNIVPYIGRTKSLESIAEKIETGRYKSFAELDDLVAFTLVVPNRNDEGAAVAYCKTVFSIFEEKTRSATEKSPDVFRFDVTRLYGRLINPAGSGTSGGITVHDVIFEIQIRTAFEHAWIASTHPLVYKTENVEWRRLRLAAELKAAVEHLDLSIVQFDTLASAISESPFPNVDAKKRVAVLVKRLSGEGVIPTESLPKDLSRFAENFVSLIRSSKKNIALDDALAQIEMGLRAFGADKFPRSASLLQISMAMLFQAGLLKGPLQRYACHMTAELTTLFPGVDSLTPIFQYPRNK